MEECPTCGIKLTIKMIATNQAGYSYCENCGSGLAIKIKKTNKN